MCVCVCVCQQPLCSETPSWPGPLHMGFVLIVFAERRRKWMLSELIGMTKGAYGCVCVGVWSWQPPYSSVQGCQVLHERTHWESTNHAQIQQTGSWLYCPTGGSVRLFFLFSLLWLLLPSDHSYITRHKHGKRTGGKCQAKSHVRYQFILLIRAHFS